MISAALAWFRTFAIVLGVTIAITPAPAQDRGALPVSADEAAKPTRTFDQLYSASHALVIGIDDYAQWRKLRHSVDDAKAVARELAEKHGFNVVLKLDLKGADLERELRDFFIQKGSNRDARLLLWYSGHGHLVKDPSDRGYLVPADAPDVDDEHKIPTPRLADVIGDPIDARGQIQACALDF